MRKIPVIFNMATIPVRIRAVEDTIKSVLPQCDRLNIYMNSFQVPTPEIFKHPKIKVYRSEEEAGDIGDVGKFYLCETWNNCYVFTIDDKYIYPADYAGCLINTIEKYNRQAVISCHGRLLKKNCKSYYMDVQEMFLLGCEVSRDTFVHEIGTGCMALHTDTFKFTLDIFKYTNMTDILVSHAIQKSGIPLLIMSHKNKWVRVSPKCNQEYSIHNFLNRNDKFQTDFVNAFNWKVRTCPAV